LVRFSAVTGGTLISSFADRAAKDFFENQSDGVPQVIKDYGWYYGSPQNNYMLTGAVYLTGLFTKNVKLRRTGVLLISSASAAGLFQQASKYAFGRARPRSGFEYNHFRPFSREKDFHSFPSGHAILAFTNAYAIGKQFKSPWVKAGIYTIGIIPGISRLWEGAHWLSDFVFSIAVSIFTVEAVDKYLDRKYDEKYNSGEKKVHWSLKFSPNQLGVVVDF
jgi:membrane-associated phospholipid phosphatase